jgi:prepilin signal peptidase PulO-like enzyme (type II secretory pathway)
MRQLVDVAVFAGCILALFLAARSQSDRISLVEPNVLALVAAGILALLMHGEAITAAFGIIAVVACTIVAAASDIATGLVFDVVNGCAGIGILVWAAVVHRLDEVALGAGACGLLLLALHVGTRGRGIGLGDVKLCAVIGAGIGGRAAVAAIAAAFVVGAVWGCIMLARKQVRRGERIAFAPFLAAGSILVVAFPGVQFGG